ncbi:MAG: hypothetical protein Aureis2KO_26390 [Aureisphaera sp.]
MYTLKTQPNDDDVLSFLESFKEEERFPDFLELLDIMTTVSGEPPKIWGNSIIGFGKYAYKNTGTQGEWYKIGFSPRKQNITIYATSGFEGEKELMERLGSYKTGKSCLYIKRLKDIDGKVLRQFLRSSMDKMNTW